MSTTIKVSTDVRDTLNQMKIAEKESYNDVLERLIEDSAELSEATKKRIAQAQKCIRSGSFTSMSDVEQEFL